MDKLEEASASGRVSMWNWNSRTGKMNWSIFIDSMLGYKKGEFGRTFADWSRALHPEDREQVMASLAAHLQRDIPFDIQYRLKKQDGTYFWCRNLARCSRDERGIPLVMSGTLMDISSQKNEEPGRAGQDDHFISLAEHSSAGVWILQRMEQPNGTKKWIYRFLNQHMAQMLGYHVHEVVDALGPHDFALKGGDKLTDATLPGWEGATSAQPRTVAVLHHIRQKNGDVMEVESYGSATTFEGKPAVIGVTTDIPGQGARPSAAGQAPDIGSIDLNEVVKDNAKKIERLAGPEIRLEIVPGRQPCRIRARRADMEQLLISLCANARDAMEAGGSLTIRLGHITLDNEYCHANPWAHTGSYVILKITDTGCGLDPQTREHIFEPLFTTKPDHRGMGLANVHRIVNRYKGLIQCNSEPGKGAVFKVFIPEPGSPA